jgi:hypothetical protein
MKIKRSYSEHMCQIFHDYADEHGHEPVDLDEVFAWANERGLWVQPPISPRAQFKREMGRCLRSERLTDENGMPIRRNHAFKVKRNGGQGYFHWWTDILTVAPKHMKVSMQQRLLVLAAGAIQHDRDATYYNEHNAFKAQLDFDYNLAPHVENAKHPPEYPNERPPGDDDDDQADGPLPV